LAGINLEGSPSSAAVFEQWISAAEAHMQRRKKLALHSFPAVVGFSKFLLRQFRIDLYLPAHKFRGNSNPCGGRRFLRGRQHYCWIISSMLPNSSEGVISSKLCADIYLQNAHTSPFAVGECTNLQTGRADSK
jgi:hypothetical protein